MRKKSVIIGARWENILKSSALRAGYSVTEIPDGCMVVGRNKIIRVPSPYDLMLFHPKAKKSIHLDAKSTTTKKFPYSLINYKQIVELNKAASAGNYAGYLVNFESLNKVIWFSTEVIGKANFESLKVRKSIDPELGLDLGTFNDFSIDKIWEKNEITSA